MVWGLAEQMTQGLEPSRASLPTCQVLDLSHNQLSFVPPDLPEALEELHLQSNRISHVGPEAFLSTPSLRALFLRCPQGRGRSTRAGRAMVGCGDLSRPRGSGWLWPLPLHLPSCLPLGSGPTGFT